MAARLVPCTVGLLGQLSHISKRHREGVVVCTHTPAMILTETQGLVGEGVILFSGISHDVSRRRAGLVAEQECCGVVKASESASHSASASD